MRLGEKDSVYPSSPGIFLVPQSATGIGWATVSGSATQQIVERTATLQAVGESACAALANVRQILDSRDKRVVDASIAGLTIRRVGEIRSNARRVKSTYEPRQSVVITTSYIRTTTATPLGTADDVIVLAGGEIGGVTKAPVEVYPDIEPPDPDPEP